MPGRPSRVNRLDTRTLLALRARYDWRAAAVLGAAVLVVTTPLSILVLSDTDRYAQLVRDVYQVADNGDFLPLYTGWITYLTAVGWFGAMTLGLLVAWHARATGQHRLAVLTGGTGLLSAVLGLDDLFMFHEEILPRTGLPVFGDRALMLSYVLAAVIGSAYCARLLLRDRDLPVLALAAPFFALSLIADEVPVSIFQEDVAKFAGVILWFAWHIRVASRYLTLRTAAVPAAGARGAGAGADAATAPTARPLLAEGSASTTTR